METGDILICKKDNVYQDGRYAFFGQKFVIHSIDNGSACLKCIDHEHEHFVNLTDNCVWWYYEVSAKEHDTTMEYIWKFFTTQKGKANRIRKTAKYFLK